MVKLAFPSVVLIQNTTNMGFAAANNQGLRVCSGELILLLNSDTQILPGTIDKCVCYMDQHPETGVLGCRVLYPDGSFQSSFFRFQGLWDLLMSHCLGLHPIVGIAQRLGFKHLNFPYRYWGRVFTSDVEVDVVAGCYLLVRKTVVAQVGPLDESFYFYGEEEEWCFRIKRAGWKVVYFPYAEIIHVHGASSAKAPLMAVLASRRARLGVLEKTRGPFAAWLGNLIMTSGLIPRLPFWFVSDCLRARGSGKEKRLSMRRREILWFHLRALFTSISRLGRTR
jgi:GT2 family glycosyltransferase